jgi:hypothetical protein
MQASVPAPRENYPTEQSQFLSGIGRREADFDDLEE